MHRTEGKYHSSNMFTAGPPGTRVEENWLNAVQEEIAYVITQAGLSLLTADTETSQQLYAAISQILAVKQNYYVDAGAADAYVLTKVGTGAPTAYTDGMIIEFLAANENTGASTVNVQTLGIKSINLHDGSALPANTIRANNKVKAVFDSSSDYFKLLDGIASQSYYGNVKLATDGDALAKTSLLRVLTPSNLAAMDASTSFKGLAELATDAEAQAMSSDAVVLTPGNLGAASSTTATGDRLVKRLSGGQVLAAAATADTHVPIMDQFEIGSGYIKFPITSFSTVYSYYFQWKTVAIPNNSSVAFTFGFAFPNSCHGAMITRNSALADYNEEAGVSYTGLSASGMTIQSSMATNALVLGWGY